MQTLFKRSLGWLLTLVALVSALAFSGCSKEDEEAPDNWNSPSGPGDSYDRLDFDFYVGIDDETLPSFYLKSEGMCYHVIFLGWGVPAGIYSRDISEFGIEVSTSDGTFTNKTGRDGDVYMTKNGSWNYFSGVILSNQSYSWGTFLYIKSKSRQITLNYRAKFYDNQTGRYVYGSNTFTERCTVQYDYD